MRISLFKLILFKPIFLFLSLSALSFSSHADTDWSAFSSKAILPAIHFTNIGLSDWIGATEFSTQVDIIPYDKNARAIEMLMPLRYKDAMSETIRKGDTYLLGARMIPFAYLQDHNFFSLKDAAFFKIILRVQEDDIFSSQTIFRIEAYLMPQGFIVFDAFENPRWTQSVVVNYPRNDEFEMAASLKIVGRQSIIEKVNAIKAKTPDEIEQDISDIVSKIKARFSAKASHSKSSPRSGRRPAH